MARPNLVVATTNGQPAASFTVAIVDVQLSSLATTNLIPPSGASDDFAIASSPAGDAVAAVWRNATGLPGVARVDLP